jgi:hypothetical protein
MVENITKQRKYKKVITIGAIIVSIAVAGLALWLLIDLSERQLNKTTESAATTGVSYAKEQCRNSDVSLETCATINSKGATYTDCPNGEGCWIVHVFSTDKTYRAEMLLFRNNEEFVVKDYERY